MAFNNTFSLTGLFDDLSDGAAKVLAAYGGYEGSRDDRKLRSKELDNQARQLSIEAAEKQKERDLQAVEAARSFASQENLYKLANILAIGGIAGVGGWAVAKVVKSFKGR